ncbi:MAG: tRNA 4-thiouridine(8) synthase ThiI [Desulfurococcales archaeon]|nr:tRNA 4-thiouridine(8) synthase ThiI [Desulfurococcales archaeon]
MDENAVLIRYSEIAVKGWRTRRRMENLLVKAINEALERHNIKGYIEVTDGRILILDVSSPAKAAASLTRVFGVKSVSPVYIFNFNSIDDIIDTATTYFRDRVKGKVFRVRARRAGRHDFTSKDVEKLVGAELLRVGAKKVDLTAPEYTAYIEVRDKIAMLYDMIMEGPGGLPIGSEGPILVLFSGGFDSTVASWMLMKRGSPVHLLHYDLGNPEAVRIAITAAKILADEWSYGYDLPLHIANLKGASMIISGLVKPEYRILVLRRYMMEYAINLAESLGIEAIATGESLGQVASQTVRNLNLISGGLRLPVYRPVIGMDKDEIVELARRIGVYDVVSRQIEVCGQAPTPTPHGSPRIFWEEYEKIRDIPGPEPRTLYPKSEGLDKLIRAYIG